MIQKILGFVLLSLGVVFFCLAGFGVWVGVGGLVIGTLGGCLCCTIGGLVLGRSYL